MDWMDDVLDRRPWTGPVVLIVMAVLPHLVPVLLRLHVDPVWYFGFIDYGTHQGKLPGRMYLDPYLGWTGTLSRLAAQDWLRGEVPWWNPYTGIGVPLAGQMQPMAFLLPFVLLFALPLGTVWFTLAMQLLGGFATLALLRRLALSRLACLAGGAMFALNGTLAWVPGPAAVGATLAFLPVLLWGIEAARATDGRAGLWGVALGIGGSLAAGFPETAYLDGLVGLAWAGLRIVQGPARGRLAFRVGLGGVAGLLLAAPVLIAFADELAGARIVQTHLFAHAAMAASAAPLLLLPALYGPPNAVNGILWGNIGGYGGVAAACAALLALGRGREHGLRMLLGVLLLAGLARMEAMPLVTDVLNLLPAMKQVAFHRYGEGAMEMMLVVLAAFGIDAARTAGGRAVVGMGVAAAALVAAAGLEGARMVLRLPAGSFYHALPTVMGLVVTAAMGMVVLILMAGRWRAAALAGMMVAEAASVFGFALSAGSTGGRQDTASIQYLQAHTGMQRVLSLHPFAPNYPAEYGIASLGHNMSPMPQQWLDHIDGVLAPGMLAVEQGATFYVTEHPSLTAASQLRTLQQRAAAFDAMGLGFLLAPTDLVWRGTTVAGPGGARTAVRIAPEGTVVATLPPAPRGLQAAAAGMQLGTFGGTARGILHLTLCAGGVCAEGERQTAGLQDNQLALVPLTRLLPVAAGTEVTMTLRRLGGNGDLAVWEYPADPHRTGLARLADGTATLAAMSETPSAGWQLARQGTAMDIWARDKATGYFDAPGCGVEVASRTEARVRCGRAGVLTRRELYVPGWRAVVNGVAAAVRPVENVLQAVDVPAGESEVRFAFTPPGAVWAEAGMILGALILAAGSLGVWGNAPAGAGRARRLLSVIKSRD